MAVDKLVDSTQLDADLTSVANAIRTKGGTSADLAFPAGFVSAVQAIPSGGSGKWTDDDIAMRNYSGDIVITVTSVVESAFRSAREITSITGENLVSASNSYTFAGCKGLKRVNFPMLGSLGAYSFDGCSALEAIHLPNIGGLNGWAFQSCTSLETAVFPKNGGPSTRSFAGCTSLRAVDFGTGCTSLGNNNAFANDSILNVIILRRISAVVTCGNINIFTGTPFASGGSGGTLYVPFALIASYQAATNWSTILGYTNNQILPIEGSPYETAYADGTPIT